MGAFTRVWFLAFRIFGWTFGGLWLVAGALIVWSAVRADEEVVSTVAIFVGGGVFWIFWMWALERLRRYHAAFAGLEPPRT